MGVDGKLDYGCEVKLDYGCEEEGIPGRWNQLSLLSLSPYHHQEVPNHIRHTMGY